MTKKLIYVLLLILTAAAGVSASAPTASDGVLDLRDIDFQSGRVIPLEGDWQFSWQQFVPPGQPMPENNTSILPQPNFWNGHMHNGRKIPGTGYATYRLKIILPENPGLLACNMKFIHSAYRLYADDTLVSSAGTLASDKGGSRAVFRQDTGVFSPDSGEVTLTLHVSNFEHNEGGFWESIRLGSAGTVIKAGNKRAAAEMFVISCIFVMGLYHIGMRIIRRTDQAALYFGLFSILISIRALTNGEIFLASIIPSIRMEVMMTLEYLSYYAALPFFIMYLSELFPKDCSKTVKRFFQAMGILFILQVILLTPLAYNKTLIVYQLLTAAAGFYTIYILIRALILRRPNSRTLLTGFMFLFLSFVNDALHSNEILHTGFYLPAGQFIFTFSQALLILNRSSREYSLIDIRNKELKLSHDLLKRSRQGTILGLAKLAEYRDEDTGKHLERIREYCRLLAERLAEEIKYRDYITGQYIEDLFQSSILHDIGKVGVPDEVLLKPGKLTSEEFEVIKKHTLIGGNAIQNIELKTDMKSFLTLGKEIAWYHHEKWDGTGYPKGLAEEAIPLSARITAIADVYDALTSERPYKKAFSHEEAFRIISEGSGSHFDPDIAAVFLKMGSEIREIRDRLSESA